MRKSLAAGLIVAGMALTGVARADIIVSEEFTGTIGSDSADSGLDNIGFFGPAHSSLIGDTVTFSFTYDATVMGENPYLVGSTIEAWRYVPSPGDGLPPIISETVTVNGISVTDVATNMAEIVTETGPLTPGCSPDLGIIDTQGVSSVSGQIEADLCNGAYTFGEGIPLSQTLLDAYAAGVTSGRVHVAGASVGDSLYVANIEQVINGTPEPATWLTALTALGAAILAKRRRA